MDKMHELNIENEILSSNLNDVGAALAVAMRLLGIESSAYIGEVPNRYHVYMTNDGRTDACAICVDVDGRRIHKDGA